MKIRDRSGETVAYKCDCPLCNVQRTERESMLWIHEKQFCCVKCFRDWERIKQEMRYRVE